MSASGGRPGSSRGAPGYRPAFLRAVQRLARLLLPLLLRLRVTGQDKVPRTGAVLFAGNHTGFLDGPLVVLLAPRAVRALVKAELYGGLLGGLLLLAGQVPLRRGQADRWALHEARDTLAAGGAVAMFPEGTRGGGRLEQFHDGVAWLALRAGCPIVPVACVGTAEALPRGAKAPRLRSVVAVHYGKPFTLTAPGDIHARSTVAAAGELIRQQLLAHLDTVLPDDVAGVRRG